jgi:lipopolysaccharide/colanic/teichoic acid biosynthesis glycosyltransferase
LDLALGSVGLLVSLPVFVAVGAAMRLIGDHGPLFHRARRVGEGGRLFTVYKLRTMRTGVAGPAITAQGDPRVTRIGRLLRRTKLDELPQLWNVVRGEMTLVGPRPEDPKFVDWSNDLHRMVFSARPGITGPTQIDYRDEERQMSVAETEQYYRDAILPAKLECDRTYLASRSMRGDIAILVRTVMALVGSRRSNRPVP